MAKERLSNLQKGIIKFLQRGRKLKNQIVGNLSNEINDGIAEKIIRMKLDSKGLSRHIARNVYGMPGRNKPIPKKILVSISRSLRNLQEKNLLEFKSIYADTDDYIACYSSFKLGLTNKGLSLDI